MSISVIFYLWNGLSTCRAFKSNIHPFLEAYSMVVMMTRSLHVLFAILDCYHFSFLCLNKPINLVGVDLSILVLIHSV